MKKILFLLSLIACAYADVVVIDNQTSYTNLSVQWADSAREVEEGVKATTYDLKLDPKTLQNLSSARKIELQIPKSSQILSRAFT